ERQERTEADLDVGKKEIGPVEPAPALVRDLAVERAAPLAMLRDKPPRARREFKQSLRLETLCLAPKGRPLRLRTHAHQSRSAQGSLVGTLSRQACSGPIERPGAQTKPAPIEIGAGGRVT